MEQNQESVKVVYPTGDYHKVWNKIHPEPINPTELRKNVPKYEFGHRLFTQMVLFLQQAKFDKDAYSYYMNLGTARQPDEEFQDYKIRQKFVRALEKNRTLVKSSIFMNLVSDIRAKQLLEQSTKQTENEEPGTDKELERGITIETGNTTHATGQTKDN